MKIVILDGYTINPGDLDWKGLEAIGELSVYDMTPVEEVAERCREAHFVLTNKTKVNGEAIRQLPELKYIGELATGYDNIDIKEAALRNIPVCNVPGYSTMSVAQLTWALILEMVCKVSQRSAVVHEGAWIKSKDFCFGHVGLFELQGKKLGLIGLGQIGGAVAKIAQAFGMEVIANVRNPAKHDIPGIRIVNREECFAEADIVSLHSPLTESTKQMVNTGLLSTMKKSAILINTARGALINEKDLADALNNDMIAGAALDVLSAEPPVKDNPLFQAKNCIITPHIAWATLEARQRLLQESVENIKAFLNGSPRNVVNIF